MATTKKTAIAATETAEAPKKTTRKVAAVKVETTTAPKETVKATPKKAAPKAKTASQETLHTVEFIKFSPESKLVEIAGSFNNWTPAKMKKDKEGNWKIKLDLAAGQHQYKYVFEGLTWEHDPSVDSIPDGQGGWNNLKSL